MHIKKMAEKVGVGWVGGLGGEGNKSTGMYAGSSMHALDDQVCRKMWSSPWKGVTGLCSSVSPCLVSRQLASSVAPKRPHNRTYLLSSEVQGQKH